MRLVSVIMASYNGENYIREQIDSILGQSCKDFTLLVRDDGSTDATKSILEDYRKRGKLNWYTGAHLNVAMGFIDLLNKAPDSKYYSFCDQDDVWKVDKLKAAVTFLDKENQSIPLFYYSATTLVDDHLNILKEHTIHTKRTDKARFLINDMSGNSVVINKRLRDLICGGDCLGISIHDKWALQVCLALGGKCIADYESHILYRQHLNNTIGMELSVRNKAAKFMKIVNSKPDDNMMILKREYKDLIISPYRELIMMKQDSKLSWENRLKLLNDKDIDFADVFFNIAFKLKVLRGIL